jgi:hypothetical protein
MKGIGESPRKSNDESRFGPLAIQRISGCYKPITIRPKKVLANKDSKLSPGLGSNNDLDEFKIEIPCPSDNVRYYDDDSDPRVIESLAKAPLQNKGSIYLTLTETKALVPPIKPEQSPSIEYVVGLPEQSCLARKEEESENTTPKPANLVFLNHHHNVMGDMSFVRNWSNVSYCAKNPRNFGTGDNVDMKEKVEKNMEIMPPIISQEANILSISSKEIKKVLPKTSTSTPQLLVPDKKSSKKPEPIQSTSRAPKLSVSSPSTNLIKTKPPVVQSPRLQKKVVQGISKPKAVKRSRRFQKSITTVALTVPVSKNSNVMI